MGLTGIVVDATVRLLPVETTQMLVDTERADDLDDCMARMTARDDEYRYSVAWIDCLARGRHLGRARAHPGRPCPRRRPAGAPARRALSTSIRPAVRRFRSRPPSGLLNPVTVAAFNEAVVPQGPPTSVAASLEPIASFFHPLDGVGGWNRLYGRRGFVQYQCRGPRRRRRRRPRVSSSA